VSLRTKRRNRGPAQPTQPARPRERAKGPAERWLYGRHPVAAALANPERRWRRLAVLPDQEAEAKGLLAAAQAVRRGDGDPIRLLDRTGLAALVGDDAVHQGLALEVEPLETPDLDDVLRAAAMAPRAVLVVLDQVGDPQNVGAILRAAAAFGAAGVVVAARSAPPVSGALAKAASGALELVPLIPVINLARALNRLKEAGFWCCGLDERAPRPLAELDLGARVALVLGAEGDGLRRLVRDGCDYLARLPTTEAMPSLNVSAAVAIALYQLVAASGDPVG
jgi:23S rRNA (guanosine2251-2'-O)-methyltransferase